MSKILSAAFVAVVCMGAFAATAQAFDPAAFGEQIRSENPATTYSPAVGPC